MKDFYQILGVSKTATEQEIKKAYRKLAMEHHPDRNQDNQKAAEEKFKEISEAYSVLSDPQKRQKYDMGGFDPSHSSNSYHGHPFGGMGGFGFDFDDILTSFFRQQRGGFGDQQAYQQARTVIPGGDIKVETVISLEDVLSGTSEEFSIRRQAICKTCDGSGAKKEDGAIQSCISCNGTGKNVTSVGAMHIAVPCGRCAGTGRKIVKVCDTCSGSGSIEQQEKIKVSIPAGVRDGNVLRIEGKGHESPSKNGPAGHLYVVIHVKNHPIFERDEDDIYHVQTIPFTTAVLGGKVTLPILHKPGEGPGTMEVNISPGLNDEKYLQFENMGLPNLSTKRRGKQITKFLIEVPALSSLSTSQRDLLRQLEETFK